jgi:hypothetical protein
MVRTKTPKKEGAIGYLEGYVKKEGAHKEHARGPHRGGGKASQSHPEEDGHPGSGSNEVKLEVSRFLFPIELACHAPKDVHPVGDHRPAQDRKAREFRGSADGPIDVDIGRDLEEGEEHVEDDPALFSPDPDEPRIGPAHYGA